MGNIIWCQRRNNDAAETTGKSGGGADTSQTKSKKRRSEYTVGYVDGCFDLMHSGHFNAIRQAK